MPFLETGFPGLLVFEPAVFNDSRGYFYESYNEQTFAQAGVNYRFVQDNQAKSGYGVIRGLHYQLEPHAQVKLVRAISGTILDVVLDIRRGSPTYGKHFSIELSGENMRQLLIPAGFAHGYSVLSESAVMFYKCDALYHKASESGVRYNDPAISIDWKIPAGTEIVSEKDLKQPFFADCPNNFNFQP